MAEGALLAEKYRLVRPLGEGAMGSVWEAINVFTRRRFAVKLIASAHMGSAEAKRRLLREAAACGRLEHRNVIQMYDVGTTSEGDPFLVMELLSGETLKDLLMREGKLSFERVVPIALSIARGVGCAHAAGIVHRDLKPANVFLHRDPDLGTVVKVLDFGVSKSLVDAADTATMTGVPIGSPAYMSPEQARGDKSIGPGADLWALGVLLFEMITGKRPFIGESTFEVVSEIMKGQIPRLAEAEPSVEARLDHLVGLCLQRDTAARVQSAHEVIALLESLASQPTTDNVGTASGAAPCLTAGDGNQGSDIPGAAVVTASNTQPLPTKVWQRSAPSVEKDAPGAGLSALRGQLVEASSGGLTRTASTNPARKRTRRLVGGLIVAVGALAAGGLLLSRPWEGPLPVSNPTSAAKPIETLAPALPTASVAPLASESLSAAPPASASSAPPEKPVPPPNKRPQVKKKSPVTFPNP